MAENQGLFGITPQLEAEGRLGDTEVGLINSGSLVIPAQIATLDEVQELKDTLAELFSALRLDFNNFVVTPENTNYATDQQSAVQAHLTNGEIVIPKRVLDQSDELMPALQQLYDAAEVNVNQYVVGHADNSINPDTGLPEFWGFGGIFKAVKSVVGGVVDAVKSVVDGVGDFISDVGDFAVDALASPIGQIAVSVLVPQYAAYINAASKVASGQDLTAYDFVSLGIQGYSDLNAGVKVPDAVQKATKVAARIADGADPITSLVGAYGADFIKESGLADSLKTTIGNVVGEDAYNFIENNMDLNQAAADLIAGEQPLRILSNQFGDEITSYVAGDDPNLKALGYAGITTAVGIDEGLSPEKALLRGAKEYYDRGGELPDIGKLGTLSGIDLPDIPDLGIADFLKETGKAIGDLMPDLDLGSLKGWDFEGVDLGDYKFGDLNLTLPEMQNLGIDLKDINLNIPQLTTVLALGDTTKGVAYNPLDDNAEASLFNVDFGNELLADEPLLSRQVLGKPF